MAFIRLMRLHLLLLLGFSYADGQTVKILSADSKISFRGLSVVNDRILWVSGSNGTIGRSLDSGNTWKWISVKGFEKSDFRDIEAFTESAAVIMSTTEPSCILRTIDGGETWKIVYENKTDGMFLDAMEFWNEMSGIVVGDPINGKFFIARTFDGGNHWGEIPSQFHPAADSGEACFAASGTNLRKINNKEAVFVSGGKRSRLFLRDQKIDIPFITGKETAGANSIAAKNSKIFIAVGGDFENKNSVYKNCFITTNAGREWGLPDTPPNGYRSCVEYISKQKWITCGLNGVDISTDNGNNWKPISANGFNVCRKAKKGKAVYLAGNGKIGKLIF